MFEENAGILDRLFEAWNRRDFETAIQRYMHPEVDFKPGLLPPGEEAEYLGHEGVRRWVGNATDLWVAVNVQPKERIETEDGRILSIDQWHFRGRDEIEVEEELPTVFTFRDGLIVRVVGFTDRAEAFKATGIKE